jgi:hypothetical protein
MAPHLPNGRLEVLETMVLPGNAQSTGAYPQGSRDGSSAHRDVVTYVYHPVTDAMSERPNSNIQEIKSMACGFVAVSNASIWQKKSFRSRGSLPIIPEMAGGGGDTDVSTRSPLFLPLTNSVDRSIFLNSILGPVRIECELLAIFLGRSIGMKYELLRRPSKISSVMPSPVKRKCAQIPRKGD